MAEIIQLDARKRNNEKPKQLRRENGIPAVVYGPGIEGAEGSIPLVLEKGTFQRVFRKTGMSTLIGLDVDGHGFEVLVQDIDRHPVTDEIIHVDFQAIKRGEKIVTSIPLSFMGESAAVKMGGILNTPIDEIEVKVLPRDLISEIEIDISELDDYSKSITVADLKLDPEKFEVALDGEQVIASVSEPKMQEEEEPEEAEDEEGEMELPEVTGQRSEGEDKEDNEEK